MKHHRYTRTDLVLGAWLLAALCVYEGLAWVSRHYQVYATTSFEESV